MKVLVIGGSNRVWDEVDEAKSITDFDSIVCVNVSGTVFVGRVDHWVSFHTLLLPKWIERRAQAQLPPALNYWTSDYKGKGRPKTEVAGFPLKQIRCDGGSSGLIATKVALHIGGTHVILAGIPMDADRAHFDSEAPWKEATAYREAWLASLPGLKDRVRSMSGWTAELLGMPSVSWLNAKGTN